jgi:hypothetical protein
MAFLGQEFKVGDVEPSNDFEPIPAGWYTATVAGAELKDTKAGTGKYISVRFDVTGPSHEGRVVFTNLNIQNPNPKAEDIGRQQLDQLMRATGLAMVQDTDQLIGGNCSIKVVIRNDDTYGNSNEVKGFKAIEGSAAPAPKAEAPAASGNSAPWAK